MINKYGSKGAWQKLMDAGIVNAVGEIYTNKETNDIMALEFLTVKSFEDYIIESLNPGEEEYGKTYKDGFMNAFGKLVKKLYSAMNPSDNPEGPEGPEGPEPPKGGKKLKSNLPEDELEPIEFPEQKGKKKKKGDDGDDVPEPIIGQGEDEDENEDEEDKSKKKKGAGKGGSSKTDDELTDADRNKLADDINKRTEGGTKKVSTKQNVEYSGGLGTGSFKKEGLSDRDLKESGYSDEDIDEINKVRDLNKTKNTKARLDRERDVAKRNLRHDAGSSFIAKQMDNIEVESEKYKNIWKKILEEFIAKKTRRAGRDTPEGYNDWVNKKSISRGEYGIHHRMIAQDPQDVNVYVDVSGSVDLKLLEIICKSLVIFTQEWEYSGINICPWASSNGAGGVKKIRDFYDKNENEITDEILKTISEGKAKCGGGTTSDAAISALLDCIQESLKDDEKEAKDDIHIIITDGQLDDISNFENKMSSAIRHTFNRPDVAENAPKHTFWMIYDASEGTRKEFEEEIKEGKLIFISSEVVKNNG